MRDIEAQLETRQLRRMRAEPQQIARLDRRIADAEQQIGELCREGRKVLYVFPVGGKYREGNRADLIAFLIRNNYA